MTKYSISIKGIFNSDDIDSAKEYEQDNNVKFYKYDGEKGTMYFSSSDLDEINKIEELFKNSGVTIIKKI